MRPAFLSLLAVLVPLLLAAPAAAQPVQPLDRLLPEVRRSHPGEFYDADGPHPGTGGSQHYHLKWMTPEGRIVWYDMDARTGRVLGTAPGRDRFDGRDQSPYRGYEGRRGYDRPDYYGGRRGGQGGPRYDGAASEDRSSRFRGDMGGFGDDFSGRWSGPRVDGPRGNGQVWGGPGFGNRNYGGSFGGGRYRNFDRGGREGGGAGTRGGYNRGAGGNNERRGR